MNRRDYGRWHASMGYGLLAFCLFLAIYFAFAAEWVGFGLNAGLVAFVLWTLHRGN